LEQIPLSAADVATATGGRILQGDGTAAIGRISIDSRTLAPGDFFVAIRGERFDGHAFVADVLRRGAMGALVDAPGISQMAAVDRPTGAAPAAPEAGPGRPALVIQVPDTTRGLQDLARDVRRRSGARVVAITGSAGKTTTKEVAADFLSSRYRVFRNKGNLNNHIGLPLSLLELRSKPDVAVVELGMNHPGEIETLVGIAEPDVRVWTNVGDAHMGFFASADAIADAKAEILGQARPEDVLVANADDARVMARARRFAGTVVTFGMEASADVRAASVEDRGLDGTAAEIATAAGTARLETPLLGLGNLANVLAAAAVALHFDVSLDDIVERARALRPASHRGELLRLPGGVTLIDDSYNSSPSALRRTLQTVAAATGSARKVAVIGEMLELGDHAIGLHVACGRAAAAAGLDLLIAVGGPPAAELARAAVAAGLPERAVAYVAGSREAADVALQRVRPGDLVLVKGSRGIGTDLVVERLKGEFA
jgi:UDP-N-acetylmuramoyl-tripeptide--D-alanyl-D-alanine ligase